MEHDYWPCHAAIMRMFTPYCSKEAGHKQEMTSTLSLSYEMSRTGIPIAVLITP